MKSANAFWILLAAASAGFGQEFQGRIDELPEAAKGVDVEEKLGAMLPMDASFVDSEGKRTTLGDCFADKKTVILTLNYFDCPVMCQVQLEGLVAGMRKTTLDLGKDYKVVTIDIDPREGPERAATAEKKFLDLYERSTGGARGWHFLTAGGTSSREIERVADSVGYRYKWLPKQKQFSHQAAIMVISPLGKVCRYLYGVEFKPETLRMALIEASEGKLGTTLEHVIFRCFVYDPAIGSYKLHAMRAMQLISGAIAVLLAIVLGLYWRKEILGWAGRGRPTPA
jgi:protein SCO1/2